VIPGSTYRLQLHAGFNLKDAVETIPYLAELGIDWLYCSPLSMSTPGSEHGYDVVDPTRIDPELGSEADLRRLVAELHAHGLGLLLDVVPNHMGTHEANTWWVDVLENGQASAYARFFDIDWKAGGGKLLLPVLGNDLEEVLANGELVVERDAKRLWLRYYEHRFPLRLPSAVSGAEGPLTARGGPDLLEFQAYRLMRWSARKPLNYRRFFEINELVGLRIEDPLVFETVHATLFEWIARGWVNGLRIDHPDGLRDPVTYLRALQHAATCAAVQAPAAEAERGENQKVYVVVEKILTGSERLREDWPVHGTTGYEQLNLIGGVFIQGDGARELERSYAQFSAQPTTYSELAYQSKKQVLKERFAVELNRIADQIVEILRLAGAVPAFDRPQVCSALLEVVASFPVYRTYVSPKNENVSSEDREFVEQALSEAARRDPELPGALLAFIRSVLLLEAPLAREELGRAASLEAVVRFQQLTGPAAAKGIEDTAFYRYVPLACQNEVGGDPRAHDVSSSAFHAANLERVRSWPNALTATSTHDTKRSEDVRARIAALSELPVEWATAIQSYRQLNERHKSQVAGTLVPSLNDEYLLYQTLLGVWPGAEDATSTEFRQRIQAYMSKAAREAKLETSWTEPNEAYEAGLTQFIRAVLDPTHSAEFLRQFATFVQPLIIAARWTSLAQIVLKIGVPGVPDFYQGTELWDLSLVDPDNRRPVDFKKRRALLKTLEHLDGPAENLLAVQPDGAVKLLIVSRGLKLRRQRKALFVSGDYLPVEVEGRRAAHTVAFARVLGKTACVFASGRFFVKLGDEVSGQVWSETRLELPAGLPRGSYRDVVTHQVHDFTEAPALSNVFSRLPCGMLEYLE
jgi:(1->4)-alpha-D-glucan 1-alpha-D-glucosylmutase